MDRNYGRQRGVEQTYGQRLRLTWNRWLGRWLFLCTCGLAALLLLAVGLAPWLDRWLAHDDLPGVWPRVLALFANDVAVRRTSLCSAAALVVTAFVFFSPPPPPSGPR
jgi:hypothetical protein